jgi:RNA recognition motif-containing protein
MKAEIPSFAVQQSNQRSEKNHRMSFTVFLGNLPTWVTKDDIKQWLDAENLVADDIKVIRNHETQESKGFAFIEAPTQDEMQSIIRRFDRAPLEDRLLRANQAQPARRDAKGAPVRTDQSQGAGPAGAGAGASRNRRRGGRERDNRPRSAFATELAKAL